MCVQQGKYVEIGMKYTRMKFYLENPSFKTHFKTKTLKIALKHTLCVLLPFYNYVLLSFYSPYFLQCSLTNVMATTVMYDF